MACKEEIVYAIEKITAWATEDDAVILQVLPGAEVILKCTANSEEAETIVDCITAKALALAKIKQRDRRKAKEALMSQALADADTALEEQETPAAGRSSRELPQPLRHHEAAPATLGVLTLTPSVSFQRNRIAIENDCEQITKYITWTSFVRSLCASSIARNLFCILRQ